MSTANLSILFEIQSILFMYGFVVSIRTFIRWILSLLDFANKNDFDLRDQINNLSRKTLLKNVEKDYKDLEKLTTNNKNFINDTFIKADLDEIKKIKKEIKKLRKQNKVANSANQVLDQGANYIFNSPFYAAQLSTKGKGLAGFINNLTVDYSEFNWDIDKKTPMCVKLTVQFLPIHDVGPGLDYRGRLKGPIYSKAQTEI